jgi:murein DD-endopeptidase MepM/ murein hydrolase activator NlpD
MGMLRSAGLPLALAVALGLVVAGCGSDDDEAGREANTGPVAEYASAREAVRTIGREVVAQLAAGDTDPVAARFSPELAARFSGEQLRQLAAQLRDTGGIGERTDEGELVQGPDFRVYQAEHQVGAARWTFGLVFDAEGSIVGGDIQPPPPPLPPDPKAGYRTQSNLRFPAGGEWFVYWGGDTDRTNYHVRAPDQRHAYDLVVWRNGATHRGAGTENDDYWAWGQEVLAPAAATVVEALDGVTDNQPQTAGAPADGGQATGGQAAGGQAAGGEATHPAGNHVLLDVGHGEYVLLAHFQEGSVRVKAGDRVEEGQVLGLCGSSGNSSEPHIHVHLQDSSTALQGAGLPLAFSDLIVDGDGVASAELLQGQFVASDPRRS